MIQHLPRAAAAAILGALAGAALLVLAYAVRPAVTLEMNRDLPSAARGFYAPELSGDLSFAWTDERAEIVLPGLDRRAPWICTIRLRGGRTDPGALPEVAIAIDGVTLSRVQATNTFQDVVVAAPPRPDASGGLTLGISPSTSFNPGGGDPRRLGVMLDRINIEPGPGALMIPPPAALVGAAGAAAAMGTGFGLIGVTAASAVGGATLVALGQAFALSRGFGPFTPYAVSATALAFWIALASALGVWIVETVHKERLRNTARFVAAFSAGALYLKLLTLLHPGKHIGDVMFHAHRFEWVMSGRYFFTSIAPGGYQFPYPVGLYLFAEPLAALTDNYAALLRIVVAAADAAAGLLLYPMIVRAWGGRLAGAIAVALFHLMPIGLAVQGTGNLTNSFAQSLSVAALAALTLLPFPETSPHSAGIGAPRSRRLPAAAGGAEDIGALSGSATLGALHHRTAGGVSVALVAAAFLSHTSTFLLLFTTLSVTGVLYSTAGGRALHQAARVLFGVLAIATVLSVALYYAHFPSVYRSQLNRISGEVAESMNAGTPSVGTEPGFTTQAEPRPVRTIAQRAAVVPEALQEYFGWAILALAAAGGWRLFSVRARDRLGLTLAGWLLASLIFLVIGILTPVDLRYYLAAFPAVAIIAAIGASWGWESNMPARTAVSVLLVLTVWIGVRDWIRLIA